MQVLVATRESQGVRDRDVWRGCHEGEPVRPVEERCGARRGAGCECETAFVGVRSGGLTSTAVVAEVPGLTRGRYAAALRRSLSARESSWIVVPRYAEELLRVAGGLVGTGVLERWDQWMSPRFDEEGALKEDVATISDDADLLAALDEEAEVEDGFAMEERRASGEFDDPGRLRPARPAAHS